MSNASTAPDSDIALPINNAHEHRNSSGDVGRDDLLISRARLGLFPGTSVNVGF